MTTDGKTLVNKVALITGGARRLGAEIARAVVNFDGPILFQVVSRYHGGAYVVFSQELNPGLRASALTYLAYGTQAEKMTSMLRSTLILSLLLVLILSLVLL